MIGKPEAITKVSIIDLVPLMYKAYNCIEKKKRIFVLDVCIVFFIHTHSMCTYGPMGDVTSDAPCRVV